MTPFNHRRPFPAVRKAPTGVSLLHLFRIGRKVQSVAHLIEEANVSKSLWKSRTFWVNLISAVVEIGQLLSGTNLIPAGYLTLIVNALNVILRYLTTQPVHVVAPKS